MHKFGKNDFYNDYFDYLSDDSTWVTVTPSKAQQSLPFHVMEAGHFITNSNYRIERNSFRGYLMLFTLSGQGQLTSGKNTIALSQSTCTLIDCAIYHEYHTSLENWEFLWMHIEGDNIQSFYNLIYPDQNVTAIKIKSTKLFKESFFNVMEKSEKSDLKNYMDVSLLIHDLCNTLYNTVTDSIIGEKQINSDIQKVLDYIEENYSEPISIDDMTEYIHVSKYHFIRSFRRVMGVPPYTYLTTYRITVAKKLLLTTDYTVQEISEKCGFLDASNFIAQFKKHTGLKPMAYKKLG